MCSGIVNLPPRSPLGKPGKHAPCRKGLEVLLVLPLYETEKMKRRKELSLNIRTDFSPMYSGFCACNSFEHAVYVPKHEGLKEPEMLLSRIEKVHGKEKIFKEDLMGEIFRKHRNIYPRPKST